MKAEIRVGLLGLGTVGSGVARALAAKEAAIAERVGCPVRIVRALVRELEKARDCPPLPLTTDPGVILDDPEIDVVVEVLGGEQPACDYMLRALANGKPVVTANKEVMAKHGPRVLAAAAERGADVLYEAAVGGGIPVVGPFKADLVANEISRVAAIINGTTNYMLTQMASGTQSYAQALAEAQQLGYAEPDPTNDVEGIDAAYKLAILASLAFRTAVHPDQVYREGITRLAASDFRYARELGYVIKLLASGRLVDGAVEARVHPALVPQGHILARVDGVFNAVQVEGDLVGPVLFHGRGAGAGPTASAIVADLIDLAHSLARRRPLLPIRSHGVERPVRPMAALRTRYYLRVLALDRPGVMAQITKVLGDLEISLASVVQKEDVHVDAEGRIAEIVLTTHEASEAAVQEAVHQLGRLAVVRAVGSVIRVEG